jgi:hypothetical protein
MVIAHYYPTSILSLASRRIVYTSSTMATVELPFGRRIQKAHENYAEGSSLSFLGRMAKDFITSDFEKSLISSYKDELKDKYTGRGVPEVSPKVR